MSGLYGSDRDRAKVRVVVRTKPTSNFPHDIISISEEDGKVEISLHNLS